MASNNHVRVASGILGNLPPELLDQIISELPSIGVKNLRLTCTYLSQVVQLNVIRVFLSPNPVNIEISKAITDHKILRSTVTEIIYDDTCFYPHKALVMRIAFTITTMGTTLISAT
ncbi:hypothetical protein FSARC_9695 [Fusarium sarcochroum]|uniref:F-box domain-containing protein n=1 Tax=Fusarium sarcochroum TaxID=1208366 RepID=A0A8H4TQS2_9HYPO|nr:hypothetical protein FSARC_9695 [Fusarium sarcochroum]